MKIEVKGGRLHVCSSGTIGSTPEFLAYVRPQIAKIKKHDILRVLSDERGITFELDYAEIVELAETVANLAARPLGIRVAVLMSATTPEFHRNYETAAVNRAMVYRAFDDEEEALAWLRERGK
ncbi:hypothetical protein GM415_02985 [Pseudodesulfovibrio cashew]|uniref:STAS/SEC14 domain-containing protein n=1 Tax=Pseudodesulfovibrio cashew TaxID=2678688 RepID=A0A6I6JDI5_9BACT|nr:hypothetical protein [Pseudodesulfovibrio cashew]QGY39130.1 hypothetical protein GM415_02985 [Pseudodesulfovibrio cashew]